MVAVMEEVVVMERRAATPLIMQSLALLMAFTPPIIQDSAVMGAVVVVMECTADCPLSVMKDTVAEWAVLLAVTPDAACTTDNIRK